MLYHNEFANGTSGECNNGDIRAHGYGGPFHDNYFSHLYIFVSNESNNKTVNCSLDSEINVGESCINVAGI